MANFYVVNSLGTFNFDTIQAAQVAAKGYVAQGVATELHVNTVLTEAMVSGEATSDFGGITLIFDQGSGSTQRFDCFRIPTGVTTGPITMIANGAHFEGQLRTTIGNKSSATVGPTNDTSIVDGDVSLTITNSTVDASCPMGAQSYITGNVTLTATNCTFGDWIYGANYYTEVGGNISISLTDCKLSADDTLIHGCGRSHCGGTIEINAVRVTGGSICGEFSGSGFANYVNSKGVTINVTDSVMGWVGGAYSQHTVSGDVVVNVTGSTITGPGITNGKFGAVSGFLFSVTGPAFYVNVEDCVLYDHVVGGNRYGTTSSVDTGDVYVSVKNSTLFKAADPSVEGSEDQWFGIYGIINPVNATSVHVYVANVGTISELVLIDGGTAGYSELTIGAGTTTVLDYLDPVIDNLVFDVTEGAAFLDYADGIVASNVAIIADPTVTASYTLASGFAAQDTVFTVRGYEGSVSLSSGKTSGTITGNDGSSYTLTMSGNNLLLDVVGGTVTPPPTPTETVAEVVLTITDPNHAYVGATGGWKVQNDQTVAWQDITTLGEGFQILGLGATAAQKAMPDIYVYSEASKYVGAYVTDAEGAVASFESIFMGEAALMQVGIADFNADGVSDLLLRTADGFVGYYANGAFAEVQGLGTEWTVAALGDVDGNGRADVIIAHEAGYVGAYLIGNDGSISWADLGNLDSTTAIVGAGDVNGDGTDDVIVQVGANYYGAWLCGQGAVTGFFGIGTFDATVQDIADYNADGKDDLLFRTAGGVVGAALITGADTTTWAEYGALGAEWSTKGVGVL